MVLSDSNKELKNKQSLKYYTRLARQNRAWRSRERQHSTGIMVDLPRAQRLRLHRQLIRETMAAVPCTR